MRSRVMLCDAAGAWREVYRVDWWERRRGSGAILLAVLPAMGKWDREGNEMNL